MADMVDMVEIVVNEDMMHNKNMVDSIDMVNMQKTFGYLKCL